MISVERRETRKNQAFVSGSAFRTLENGNSRGGAAQSLVPLDVFSPSDKSVWKPVNRAQFAQVVFGGSSQAEELRAVGALIQERGVGGHLRKAELQGLSRNNFADVSLHTQLPSIPDPLPYLKGEQTRALFYTNNPEKLYDKNLLLAEGELPAGTSRLMSHHVNPTKEELQLSSIFRNSGHEALELRFEREGRAVGSGQNAGRVGTQAYKDYLQEQEPRTHRLEPGESYVWSQGTLGEGQALSTLASVTASAPVQVSNVVTASGDDPLKATLKRAELETSERKSTPDKPALRFRGSGIYDSPDKHRLANVPMSQNKIYQVVLGPKDRTGGSTYDGEYGQELHMKLQIGADAKPKQRLAIVAWPGGNDPAAVRTLGPDNQIIEAIGKPNSVREANVELPNRKQVAVLFEGEVKPGQILNLDQMVQGGASTPLRFLIIPIPPVEESSIGGQKGLR